VFLLGSAAILAACGGDDDDAAATTVASNTTAATQTTAPPSGASTPAPSGDPLKVVLIADQTGGAVPTSVPSLNGALLAIAEVNANGGVNGRQIETEILDSQTTPEGGQAAARKAIEEKPDAIMMMASSTPLAGAAAVLDAAGIPTVSNVGFDDLVLPPRDWYYTVGFTYQQGASYYVESARNLLGGQLEGKVIQFVGVQTPTIDGTLEIIQDQLKDEGSTMLVERTQLNMSSFTSQAEKIAGAAPDIVLSMDTANNSALEAAALQTAGYTGPIVLSTAASSDTLFGQINLPNVYAGRPALVAAEGTDLYDLAQKYGIDSEGSFFGVGYGTGTLLVETLAACDPSCDVAGFQSAIEGLGSVTVPHDAMYGPLQISADRHYASTAVKLFSWDSATTTAKPLPEAVSLG
jgi:branched-chain amino acid transport system substrate-binding protein